MAKRKSITKKLKFEVFKRDSFKCQYCGKAAPDVILEIDHIKPVSENGSNDMTNLITACFDCNRGKSNVLLDDNSILEKQRKQLEEINEKRLQLEMMMDWREHLVSLEDDQIEAFQKRWSDLIGYTVNENGLRSLRQWLKKFNLNLLLDCMEIAVNQYIEYNKDGEAIKDSVEKTFKYIPRIAANKLKGEEEPYMKDLYYIRAILKNRLTYVDPVKAIDYLKRAHLEANIPIENLQQFAKEVKHWTRFCEEMEDVIYSNEPDF